LLPLTPFLAALLILGWRHVESVSRERDGRGALEWTVIAVCCFTRIAPLFVVRVSDGPRAPYGRLWTPLLWRRWQDAANYNQAELRALVNDPSADSTAIITDTWDGDRYLHLALQETGYRVLKGDGIAEFCEKTTETFAKEHRRILHVRLHQPFLPNWAQLAAARLEKWATPCLALWKPRRLIRLTSLGQLQRSLTDSASSQLQAASARAVAVIAKSRYRPQVVVDLTPSSLASVRQGYMREAEQEDAPNASRRSPTEALHEAEHLMSARVWKSPRGVP
jgi:hypothetical protein